MSVNKDIEFTHKGVIYVAVSECVCAGDGCNYVEIFQDDKLVMDYAEYMSTEDIIDMFKEEN